jgi:hypothetical protein
MKSVVARRIKKAARVVLYGQDSSVYEDEEIGFNLKQLTPRPDDGFTARRLNVLTPALDASRAFGGLATLIEFSILAFRAGLMEQGWHLRFVCTGSAPGADDNIVTQYLKRHGVPETHVSMHYGSGDGEPVPVGAGDAFLGSLWYSQLAALPLMQFQHAHFGGARVPYISMVQDYEPGFYPWSSAYLLARGSYDSDWPKKIIFNSLELSRFYKAQGHVFDDSIAFDPVLNASLREARTALTPSSRKERRILFYGRPGSRRNCYFLARRSLEIWARTYENAKDWRVVSVGTRHRPFDLGHGVQLDVLGKLSLDGYAEELRRAALGLSLMASPHPSYPPLEMAHFGALTVCNSFDCKDLRQWHENLKQVDVPSAENIAQKLTQACQSFESDPTVGLRGQSLKPDYLAPPKDGLMQDIAAMIARE